MKPTPTRRPGTYRRGSFATTPAEAMCAPAGTVFTAPNNATWTSSRDETGPILIGYDPRTRDRRTVWPRDWADTTADFTDGPWVVITEVDTLPTARRLDRTPFDREGIYYQVTMHQELLEYLAGTFREQLSTGIDGGDYEYLVAMYAAGRMRETWGRDQPMPDPWLFDLPYWVNGARQVMPCRAQMLTSHGDDRVLSISRYTDEGAEEELARWTAMIERNDP